MSGVGANLVKGDSMAVQSISPRRAEDIGDSAVNLSGCFDGQSALHYDALNTATFPRTVFVPEDSLGIPLRDTKADATNGNSRSSLPTMHTSFHSHVDNSNVQQTISAHHHPSYRSTPDFRSPENAPEHTTTSDTWQKEGFPSDERIITLEFDSARFLSNSGTDLNRPHSLQQQPQQTQQTQQQPQQRGPFNDRETLSTFSSTAANFNLSINSQWINKRLPLKEPLESVDQTQRSDMGYTSTTTHLAPWGRNTAIKMERSASQTNSEVKHRDEDSHSAASTASATTTSPTLFPIYADLLGSGGRHNVAAIGTPSTVSTAFSADDVSVDEIEDYTAMEKLSLSMEDVVFGSAPIIYPRNFSAASALRSRTPAVASHNEAVRIVPQPGHGRNHSWDDGSSTNGFQQQYGNAAPTLQSGYQMPQRNQWPRQSPNHSPSIGPTTSPRGNETWSSTTQPTARVASFRIEGHSDLFSHSQVSHIDVWNQQRRFGEHHPLLGQHPSAHGISHDIGHMHRHQGSYPLPPRPQLQVSSITPPRAQHSRQGQPLHRPTGGSSMHPNIGPPSGANPPRSSSEILKTLLRKKACLYEPDTSRAVALVTWLVGRELALAYGYFSRQQLQSGVHACVSSKIFSGTITRTKVNRCMQIILNSCFHYIIPRPDGSEENGESFISIFGEGARDSSKLLRSLPAPWNDIVVDRDIVLSASEAEDDSVKKGMLPLSPQSSPRFGPVDGKFGDFDGEGKRAVLLCFNENVRSAEDVFRCHNEFIRDTANASKLQLTAPEWRAFFGKDSIDTPMMWGGSEVSSKGQDGSTIRHDHFGRMNREEAQTFRTTWCAKRYEHEHTLCGFAHVEINGGWLRRNPLEHQYGSEFCKSLITVGDNRSGHKGFVINMCGLGVDCQRCHTKEEILYHPDHYKNKLCIAASPHGQSCAFGDVCPYFHPFDSILHHMKKPQESRHQRHRHNSHQSHSHTSHGKIISIAAPEGSPMLYVHPAPLSSFEKQLVMPGLQSLFRRHSAVIRAQLHTPVQNCMYSPFGDNWGIGKDQVHFNEESVLTKTVLI